MPNLTYGKIFQTMFTGSMCGAGAGVYAVMSYVIAFMQPDKERVEHVRLQVGYLAKVIGEEPGVIQAAIDFLMKEDAASNSPEDKGARLVLEAPFTYRVVNGRYYRELKDEDDRRRKDADRAAAYRERKKQRAAALSKGETLPPTSKRARNSKPSTPPDSSGNVAKLEQTHGPAAAEKLADYQAEEHAANVAELNGDQSKMLPAAEEPVRIRPFGGGV